jgi:hypothetical protein
MPATLPLPLAPVVPPAFAPPPPPLGKLDVPAAPEALEEPPALPLGESSEQPTFTAANATVNQAKTRLLTAS